MIKSVDFCQNIKIPKTFAFKAQQEDVSVVSPIENTNLAGVNALATYNSSLVKDKFDIPLLKPVKLPKNLDDVQGEHIYNSKGGLECVVKNIGDKKYVYYNNHANSYLKIYDTKTGNKIFEQQENDNFYEKGHNMCYITEFDPKTGHPTASATYKDGMAQDKTLRVRNSDGSYDWREYDYCSSEYNFSFDDAEGNLNSYKTYDSDKKLKSVHTEVLNEDSHISKWTYYSNGKEISNETNIRKAVDNPEFLKYLQNPELKPAECPEFITDIDNIEGEKTYYSNGQLESVKTPDGKVYEISFDKNCITLKDKNKTIEFSYDQYFDERRCDIYEDYGAESKRTSYICENGNELSAVEYKKGNIEKTVYYDISYGFYSYNEWDTSKYSNIISIDFTPSGKVMEVRYGENYNRY